MAGVAETAHPNVLVMAVKRPCWEPQGNQRKFQLQVALVAVAGGSVDDRGRFCFLVRVPGVPE